MKRLQTKFSSLNRQLVGNDCGSAVSSIPGIKMAKNARQRAPRAPDPITPSEIKPVVRAVCSRPHRAPDDLIQPLLHHIHLADRVQALRLGHAQLLLQLPDAAVLVILVVLKARQRGYNHLDFLGFVDEVASELNLTGFEIVLGEGFYCTRAVHRLVGLVCCSRGAGVAKKEAGEGEGFGRRAYVLRSSHPALASPPELCRWGRGALGCDDGGGSGCTRRTVVLAGENGQLRDSKKL